MNNKFTIKKVAVGISGGVDSAVSALKLKEMGYEVVGVFMQCWDAKADGCRVEEDKKYAVETASKLDIKFISLDFRQEYKDRVIEYFYKEYKEGRTPNPDIMCNKEIKFGLFYDWAMKNGFDYVATGHYARVQKHGEDFNLLKGIDVTKDQSYFLYRLEQRQLERVLFPIGDMLKKNVREIALSASLPPAERPDSVGICFIGEVDIKDFLRKRLPEKKGDVMFVDGSIIGDHDGSWFYTIGQRHGFRVTKYFGKPLYVISKNVERNELVVGYEEDCFVNMFNLKDMHWINGDSFNETHTTELNCDIRIRHLGRIHKAVVTKDIIGLKVKLDEKVFGAAPGQSAVLYLEDIVLGGGIISL